MTDSLVPPTPVTRKEKCQSCGKRPAEELHVCPYAAEINDDTTTLCNCCLECTGEHADDI